jgi:hypothetical protein
MRSGPAALSFTEHDAGFDLRHEVVLARWGLEVCRDIPSPKQSFSPCSATTASFPRLRSDADLEPPRSCIENRNRRSLDLLILALVLFRPAPIHASEKLRKLNGFFFALATYRLLSFEGHMLAKVQVRSMVFIWKQRSEPVFNIEHLG